MTEDETDGDRPGPIASTSTSVATDGQLAATVDGQPVTLDAVPELVATLERSLKADEEDPGP